MGQLLQDEVGSIIDQLAGVDVTLNPYRHRVCFVYIDLLVRG